MQLVVSGLLTSYRRSGQGKQVLILHGWGDSAAGWGRFADSLADQYEVIVPDLPGFGGTQAPGEAWGLSDYADFVAAFINKAQLKPFVVIGHSNGGAIAIRGLANEAFGADKLVLIASAGIRGEYRGRTKALRLITKTAKLLAKPLPTPVQQKLRRKVYNSVGSDMLVAEHLQATFRRVITDDVRADAAKLSLPTLLLYGEADEQTPVRYGELLHELIPSSTLEVLPSGGHFLHLEQLSRVLPLVEEFLT